MNEQELKVFTFAVSGCIKTKVILNHFVNTDTVSWKVYVCCEILTFTIINNYVSYTTGNYFHCFLIFDNFCI